MVAQVILSGALTAAVWRPSWVSIERIGRPFPLQTHRVFRCAECESRSVSPSSLFCYARFLSATIGVVSMPLIEDLAYACVDNLCTLEEFRIGVMCSLCQTAPEQAESLNAEFTKSINSLI
jgi:hypothetical protein